eukprot:CAMPEP_0178576930 /NCGR_PEP_ID=MMETSP0697-20121206/20727_1 /TAXON_ID=265572 /ORGANISM="Extubocellulus spinifer, Strain CCMP396" /LENGTH=194 /DNA_ID=CAMNT_0020212175 /DNA_START=171 /DNA_END=755 /DNA_ORIENTATION=-
MPTDVRIVSAADGDSSGKEEESTEAPASNNNRSTADDTNTCTHQNLNAASAASSASSPEDVEARLTDSLVAFGELKRISRQVGTYVISARLARKRMSMSPTSADEEDKHTKRQKTDTANDDATDTAGASSDVRSLPSTTGISQQEKAKLKKLMDTFVILQRAQDAFEEEIKATLEGWKGEDDKDSDKDTKQTKK